MVVLFVLCGLVAGCGAGGSSSSRSSASPAGAGASHTPTVAHGKVPAYRVGQYCRPGRSSPYRSFGLICSQHHLRKR